jgi:hypothetical protein
MGQIFKTHEAPFAICPPSAPSLSSLIFHDSTFSASPPPSGKKKERKKILKNQLRGH